MRLLALHLLTIALLALAGPALAQSGDKPAGDKPGAVKKEKIKQFLLTVTPEREAAVTTFVNTNHPELSSLLAHLKAKQPRQYEDAIKDIHRVTERLAGVRERDMVLYELEVAVWTAQSKVQLLAAKLKMGDNETVRKELRSALNAQMDARLAVLKHQQAQATERLDKMNGQISQLEGDRAALIDKQLKMLEESSTSGRSSAKSSGNKQNGGKKPATPPTESAP